MDRLYKELRNMGLTEKRFDQMMESWNNDIEQVYTVVEEWGVDNCNRGYGIFDFDGTGMLEIDKIDDVDCFDTPDDAVQAAIKDGFKIIPVDELPEGFERRYLGWLDTPENRERIKAYVAESDRRIYLAD